MKILVEGRTSSNEGHHHKYVVYEDGSVEISESAHPENPKISHGHEYKGEFPVGEITKRGVKSNQSNCYPDCKELEGFSGAAPHTHLIGLRVPDEEEEQKVFFTATNEMGAKDCFLNRKKYRQEAFPLEAVQPLDTWYDKCYYGKIDPRSDAVYLYSRNDARLSVIGDNIVALDFVAAAFGRLASEYSYYVDNGFVGPVARMKFLKAKSSWVDPEIEYKRHLEDIRRFLMVDYLSKKHNSVRNFREFIQEIYKYLGILGKRYPITRTGFILSNRARTNFTGLSVDLEMGDYADDPTKDAILKDQCKLVWLTHLAARHGFFLDKNAPWRFVFNVGLEARTAAAPIVRGTGFPMIAGPAPPDLFKMYYAKAYRDDLTDLAGFALQTYVAFNRKYPKCRVYCSATDKHIMVERPPVQREDYDDLFWYEFLYRTRLLETNLSKQPSERDIRSFMSDLRDTVASSGLETTLRKISDKVKSMDVDLSVKTNFLLDDRRVPMVKSFLKDWSG